VFIPGPLSMAMAWRFAPRHRAADYHPLDDCRYAQAIKRMQRTEPPPNRDAIAPH